MNLTEQTSLAENVNHSFKQTGNTGMFGITKEFAETYSFIINVYVSTGVCILGLFGNTLGVCVLLKDRKYIRASTHRYMIALMVFDNVCLVLGIFVSVLAIIHVYDVYLHSLITAHALFLSGFLDMTSFHMSSIMLIVMALERLNALLRPFKAKQSYFSKHPRRIIVILFCISTIYILPYPFCFEVTKIETDENRTLYFLQTKPDFVNFYELYNLIETIITGVYLVVLLVINIVIPISYSRHVQKRKSDLRTSSQDNQQLKITLVVLWLAILYTMFVIPKILLQCLIYLDYDYQFDGKYASTYYFILFTGDLLQRLNSANDFFIYILISERDRKILRYVICRQCSTEEELRVFSNSQ